MHRHLSQTPLQLRPSLWDSLLNRQTKMKTRSASFCIFGCNGSTMCLDDGTDDGETHSETVVLRSEELLEQPLTRYFGNSRAIVAHGNADGTVAIVISGNVHDRATRRRGAHRVKGIAHKINQHLLNLGRVAFNGRKIVCQGQFYFAGLRGGVRVNHMSDGFHSVI